nr:unnamed protein product [Callosobruchus analis]
MFCRIFFWL